MEGERRTSSSSSRQPSISAITSGTLVPRRPSYIYEQQQNMNQMIPSSSLTLSSQKLTVDGARAGEGGIKVQQQRQYSLGTSNQVVINPTSGNLDEDSSYALAIRSSCAPIRNSSVMAKNGYNSVSSQSSSSQSEDGDEDDRISVNNNNIISGQVIEAPRRGEGSRLEGGGVTDSVLTESGLKCDIVEYL